MPSLVRPEHLVPQPGETGMSGCADQCGGYGDLFDAHVLGLLLTVPAFHALRLFERVPAC